MEHTLPNNFLTRAVKVAVVGAGGTGSQMITGLARLHHAMRAFGHPYGLDVVLIDDDIVSETNMLRQSFYSCDIGLYKAPTIINRVNLGFGLSWRSAIRRLTENDSLFADIVIGCVDSRLARKAIKEVGERRNIKYWLDCGNRLSDGQICLGEFKTQETQSKPFRLPTIADFYPEMIDPSLDATDDVPSCSLQEALEKQSLLINSSMALYACNLLFELFRFGKIEYHGNFINLKNGRTIPMEIDPQFWARMGYITQKDSEISHAQTVSVDANECNEETEEEVE